MVKNGVKLVRLFIRKALDSNPTGTLHETINTAELLFKRKLGANQGHNQGFHKKMRDDGEQAKLLKPLHPADDRELKH